MDNLQSTELINQCKHLQQRFCGIFAANLAFNTKLKRDNTFMIVNASDSGQPGTHWLLFAQAGGRFFLQILLDEAYAIIRMYKKKYGRSIHEGNKILINKPIQSANWVFRGLYCIYFAHVKISTKFSYRFSRLATIARCVLLNI